MECLMQSYLGLLRLKYRAVVRKRSSSSRTGLLSADEFQLGYDITGGPPQNFPKKISTSQGNAWWGFRDSNPGPTGYEPGALTD